LGLFLSVLLAIAFVAQALPRRPFAMTSAFFPKQYQRNDNCPSVWIHQQLRGGAQEEEDDEESDEETDDERDVSYGNNINQFMKTLDQQPIQLKCSTYLCPKNCNASSS
jgi:hypothetical protein